MNKKSGKINEALTRGVEEIIDQKSLKERMKKPIRVKLGTDPTSPNIHLGRSVPLMKLRDFQKLGHKIILIIGDFTGVIGDTSDKESERPILSEEQVKINLKTYIQQAGKIIDIEKCEIRHNGQWLGKLKYQEIGKQANLFSLNDFISRENIKKRIREGGRVSLREVLYPLMQGYDSVAVRADLEIGGTDQKFNLLTGRGIQRYYGQKPQEILTGTLIEGLDGRKMSSSWGNTINIFDPPAEMYGKIMSLKDELIIKYFTLTTRIDLAEIEKYRREMKEGGNPKKYKAKLAFELVRFYHSRTEAVKASENFERVFKDKKIPLKVPEVKVKEKELDLPGLLTTIGLVASRAEGKRLVEQGGVKIDGKTQAEWKKRIKINPGMVVQVGKRKFARIVI